MPKEQKLLRSTNTMQGCPWAHCLQLHILAALSVCDALCQEFNSSVSYNAKWFIGIIRILLGWLCHTDCLWHTSLLRLKSNCCCLVRFITPGKRKLNPSAVQYIKTPSVYKLHGLERKLNTCRMILVNMHRAQISQVSHRQLFCAGKFILMYLDQCISTILN